MAILTRRFGWREAVRFTARAALLALLGLVVSLGTRPAWAPEDPWRLLVVAPGSPTPEAITARVLDGFLRDHHVRLGRSLKREIGQAVAEQSVRHGIAPRLLLSVILSESSFRKNVVSNRGAIGLMQLMPSTARAVASRLELHWRGDDDLLDTRVNIMLGACYLGRLLDMFDGDLQLALTAYNSGPSYVRARLARWAAGPHAARLSSSYARAIVARLSPPEVLAAQSL